MTPSCGRSRGRFRLGDVSYWPTDRFYRVNIAFEQFCNGSTAPLIGNIWISSDGTTTPPALAVGPAATSTIRR